MEEGTCTDCISYTQPMKINKNLYPKDKHYTFISGNFYKIHVAEQYVFLIRQHSVSMHKYGATLATSTMSTQ